jgi:transketolase N-terminal domain/subunit
MNALEKRIIDISYRHKLTHLSSCLNTVNHVADIYDLKQPEEPFVLGNSHASLALFVVLEKHHLCDAEEMVDRHGTHANRDMLHGVWVSGGSLGQAETVAVGLALADLKQRVWLVTSDGACMEGAVWEAFRIADSKCTNLAATIIFNGFGAYGRIPKRHMFPEYPWVSVSEVDQNKYPHWLQGLPGHYLTLNEEQYQELMR